MKKNTLLLLLLLFSIILPAENGKYVKGLYLRSDLVSGSNFDSLLVLAKRADINAIVFDIKDMKGRIYININDHKTLISKENDVKINLRKVIEKIHRYQMTAIARIVAFHNKRAALSDSVYCPIDSLGNRWIENPKKGPMWLDPSLSMVQNDLFALIDTVIQSSVDEIQFDYIRFPTQGSISKASFWFQREDDRKYFADSTYVKKKKENIIEAFLKKVRSRYKKNNIRFTADIFAIVSWQNPIDIAATGQNIKRITKHLDAIHPMVYSSHFADNFGYRENVHNEPFNLVFQTVKRSQRNTDRSCNVIPYIQANSWQVNFKKEYIAAQIDACKQAEADGFLLWNASGNYNDTLKWMIDLKELQ